jgi:16S rRNA processing protein RimM
LRNKPEYIIVGQFGRPRGVSGEIYINDLTDNPERFAKPGMFWMESEDGWTEIKVVSVKYFSGRPAVRIGGIDNPEKAKELTNRYLYIKGDELKELPEGSYYHFDLMDCRAIDKNGVELGIIVKVESYPANDIWVIEKDKKRYMFPAIGQFIMNVDIDKKIIKLDPPEGIFDSADEN